MCVRVRCVKTVESGAVVKHACLSHSRTLQSGRAATIRSNAASPLIAGNLQGCTLSKIARKKKRKKKHKKDKNKKTNTKIPPCKKQSNHLESRGNACRRRSAKPQRRAAEAAAASVPRICGIVSSHVSRAHRRHAALPMAHK